MLIIMVLQRLISNYEYYLEFNNIQCNHGTIMLIKIMIIISNLYYAYVFTNFLLSYVYQFLISVLLIH